MKREQLAHILRAASQIAGDADILVIGSQAILGAYDDNQLPLSVMMSMEADVAFLDDADRSKAARREKDFAFAASLLDARLVELDILTERAAMLPVSSSRAQSWLAAYQRRE